MTTEDQNTVINLCQESQLPNIPQLVTPENAQSAIDFALSHNC